MSDRFYCRVCQRYVGGGVGHNWSEHNDAGYGGKTTLGTVADYRIPSFKGRKLTDTVVGVVPINDLRELVDEWEENADPDAWDEYGGNVEQAIKDCAQELREVLEQYE